jgi:hypothetical protein
MSHRFYRLIMPFIFASCSFGQTIIYGNAGVGGYGGVTAVPYEKPLLLMDGFSIGFEVERYLIQNHSLSFHTQYAKFDKAELFVDQSNSSAFYFGLSYHFIHPLSPSWENAFYEFSLCVAYGREKIKWRDDNIGWGETPYFVKGHDKLQYLALGFRGAIRYEIAPIVLRLSIQPMYDVLLGKNRKITADIQPDDKVYDLYDPVYKSSFYTQIKLAFGVIIFD